MSKDSISETISEHCVRSSHTRILRRGSLARTQAARRSMLLALAVASNTQRDTASAKVRLQEIPEHPVLVRNIAEEVRNGVEFQLGLYGTSSCSSKQSCFVSLIVHGKGYCRLKCWFDEVQ